METQKAKPELKFHIHYNDTIFYEGKTYKVVELPSWENDNRYRLTSPGLPDFKLKYTKLQEALESGKAVFVQTIPPKVQEEVEKYKNPETFRVKTDRKKTKPKNEVARFVSPEIKKLEERLRVDRVRRIHLQEEAREAFDRGDLSKARRLNSESLTPMEKDLFNFFDDRKREIPADILSLNEKFSQMSYRLEYDLKRKEEALAQEPTLVTLETKIPCAVVEDQIRLALSSHLENHGKIEELKVKGVGDKIIIGATIITRSSMMTFSREVRVTLENKDTGIEVKNEMEKEDFVFLIRSAIEGLREEIAEKVMLEGLEIKKIEIRNGELVVTSGAPETSAPTPETAPAPVEWTEADEEELRRIEKKLKEIEEQEMLETGIFTPEFVGERVKFILESYVFGQGSKAVIKVESLATEGKDNAIKLTGKLTISDHRGSPNQNTVENIDTILVNNVKKGEIPIVASGDLVFILGDRGEVVPNGIKKYIEEKGGREVETMKIEDGKLVVEFKVPTGPDTGVQEVEILTPPTETGEGVGLDASISPPSVPAETAPSSSPVPPPVPEVKRGPEVEIFPTKFIEDTIKKLLAFKKDSKLEGGGEEEKIKVGEVKGLEIKGKGGEIILNAKVNVEMKVPGTEKTVTSDVGIKVVLGSKNNIIVVKNCEIKANVNMIIDRILNPLLVHFVKPHLEKISETLKSYIEDNDPKRRKVEKMEIENGQLKVTFK
ncbi:hypothetical protein A3A95_00190 [Candidatus Nomurabacteria bacterium RIFCSPLOWO2_01_FULL_39_18]|uniref:Uncharacterized protein n=1 Tax=Candidatus Nomurabacteria bacterium RIFCSPHIGHO2_01_FULL_40_24b TaxID=1801739 RepID=A0A1F6V944_9BACT|nr:MAG: hypothetical protein A2647_03040 [Candidatus Nomurabacteria bacterium RIFCSPHIGHO2_01_FULL_40_24b]OGI90497.1 MAG: hypothetical protein A3A95_00190 [Candidatus Nomurabacteria bacterium RIFCSPLOWO2_01_FULL_39_18]